MIKEIRYIERSDIMYDIVVVGAGTAGLSAAIYGVRAGKSVLVLEGASYGGQIINTPEIENYPAIKKTSGFEFATDLFNQAKDLGAEVKYEKVTGISLEGNIKKVKTDKGDYDAKSVILATGAKNRPLGLPNEKKLVGSGVSYCATCDGMFYRGKTVAVNGGGNTAIEDATFLANVANKVYVIHRRDEFRAEEAVVAALKKKDNVEFVLNSNIVEIKEESFAVSGVVVEDKNTHERREIAIDGLFVAIGQVPDNTAFAQVVELDKAGYIVAGEDCKTKTEGIFAAGDGRTKEVRQLVTAAGDGAVSGIAAAKYCEAF